MSVNATSVWGACCTASGRSAGQPLPYLRRHRRQLEWLLHPQGGLHVQYVLTARRCRCGLLRVGLVVVSAVVIRVREPSVKPVHVTRRGIACGGCDCRVGPPWLLRRHAELHLEPWRTAHVEGEVREMRGVGGGLCHRRPRVDNQGQSAATPGGPLPSPVAFRADNSLEGVRNVRRTEMTDEGSPKKEEASSPAAPPAEVRSACCVQRVASETLEVKRVVERLREPAVAG